MIFAGIWHYLYSAFSNVDPESCLPEFHPHSDLPHNALSLFLPAPTALLSFAPKHVNSLVHILLCCYVLILSYEYVNVQVHTVIHKSTHRLYSHCSTKEWDVVTHTTAYISCLIRQHLTESPFKLSSCNAVLDGNTISTLWHTTICLPIPLLIGIISFLLFDIINSTEINILIPTSVFIS